MFVRLVFSVGMVPLKSIAAVHCGAALAVLDTWGCPTLLKQLPLTRFGTRKGLVIRESAITNKDVFPILSTVRCCMCPSSGVAHAPHLSAPHRSAFAHA